MDRLLAYMHDGAKLAKLLVPAFRDPSSLVRNDAMRVIADMARHHPEVEVPLDPVLDALDYPATTDRNKAAAILTGLLEREHSTVDRRRVIERAGATLLAMLRLRQPNNHDFAFRILEAVSGEHYDERDYAAWDAWLASQRQ